MAQKVGEKLGRGQVLLGQVSKSKANRKVSEGNVMSSIHEPEVKTTQAVARQITGSTHEEKHFKASDTIRDIVIGMADGLTVPFALAAGLTGIVQASRVIVTAGFAEIAAGSIAMGLGGYLAAKSDAEHYISERKREVREIEQVPDIEAAEVAELLETYGLTSEESRPIVEALRKRPEAWIDFMMRFELGLEKPDPKRALKSAATIAGSYIMGGIIPLSPYLLIKTVDTALLYSVFVTLIALFGFGFFKGKISGLAPLKNALQTVTIGGLAAAAAFGIARWIGH